MIITGIIMGGIVAGIVVIVTGLLISAGKIQLPGKPKMPIGPSVEVWEQKQQVEVEKLKGQRAYYHMLNERVLEAQKGSEDHGKPPVDPSLIADLFGDRPTAIRGEIEPPKAGSR